ncbi:hypothetical protein DFJ58DRAFT_736336 [Suillus subalutaceus]|uniref:uncharacterized protein n=1 Tax=Suillus subalutaceus TaxID=48586 RepID=UPI001B8761E6|nr:uncharacterized protein DFJ58DRAFT_736336 [Suillus subalutaceus]KAG1832551.1 hypothetical protein DFJ58DRAFT_736336 [Suillus subalutaceus]
MNPSCHFRQWSSADAQQLLKVKGTIQDVDGECSFKLTGQSHKGCKIAPHYRLPLYALNKKFGIYRTVVQHLQDARSEEAARHRNTYLSVMRYLNDVRIAFLDDAGVCSDALRTDFRSAALDYYLWLDHTGSGFHDECRTTLATAHGVTFEGLKNGQCPDILVFLDWTSYHKKKCNEQDFCGALQGSGGGEDIQSLLNMVDACIDAASDQMSPPESGHSVAEMMLVDVQPTSNPIPNFPLPLDKKCRRMALRTLHGDARQIFIGGFGRLLASHVVMRFREIQGLDYNESLENMIANGLLLTARSTEEFLEIFGMIEMISTCQELRVDRSPMARFFITAGRALYTSGLGKECVVDYDPTFGSMDPIVKESWVSSGQSMSVDIKWRIGNTGTPQDVDMQLEPRNVINAGVQCECIDEHTGQPSSSRAMSDCGVQTHTRIQDDPAMDDSVVGSPQPVLHVPGPYQPTHVAPIDTECGYSSSQHHEEDFNECHIVCVRVNPLSGIGRMIDLSRQDDTGYFLSPENRSDHSGDISNNVSAHLEASITTNADVSHTSSSSHDSSLIMDFNPLHEWHQVHGRDTALDISDTTISPPLKSRLRQAKQSRTTTTPAVTLQRQGPLKRGRPVVFATQRPVLKGKANASSHPVESLKYTIQDMVRESQMGAQSVMPFMTSFLMDPHGLNFFRLTIKTNHDMWLAIVRHLAILRRSERLSQAMSTKAASLMSIDIWLKDIAIECEALNSQTADTVLSPFVGRPSVQDGAMLSFG